MTDPGISSRIAHLIEVMASEGWDCVLASSPESVLYLSGALIHTQTLIRRRQCAVLVTRTGSATLIVAEVERALAARMSRLPRLATYNELSESACIAAMRILQEDGLSPSVVGLEKTHLPVVDFEVLQRALPGAIFVGSDARLATLRMVKSASESDTMSFAATAMDEAILVVAHQAVEGIREDRLAALISQHVQSRGGGRVRSATGLVASGENLHVSHHVADATELKAGDVMRIGCRVVLDGYHGLVARTAVVGRCATSTLDHYSLLYQAHQALLGSLRPGVVAERVYEQAASSRKALGLELKTVHVGHGIGIELQEAPRLSLGSSEPLQVGMTLVAASVSDDPIAGHLYIEDMVLVESAGARLLSNRCDTAKPLLTGGSRNEQRANSDDYA